MIRDVKLIDYLPMFVREYREIQKIMEIENPEIQEVENETEIIMNNQFIQTCDINGIKKFENLMGITPLENDTLETRISRVLSRWNETSCYTFKVLIMKLNALCGINNYEIIRNINEYTMKIITHLEYSGQTDELDYLLNYIIPANIAVASENKININLDSTSKIASNVTFSNFIELTDSFNEIYEINSNSKVAMGTTNTAIIEITDDFQETFNIEGDSKIGSNVNLTEII